MAVALVKEVEIGFRSQYFNYLIIDNGEKTVLGLFVKNLDVG